MRTFWVAESIKGAHVLCRGIHRGCARWVAELVEGAHVFGSQNQYKVRTFWVADSIDGAHVWVADSIEGAHVLGRGINRGCARFGSRNQ